jgi:hypothetical protein
MASYNMGYFTRTIFLTSLSAHESTGNQISLIEGEDCVKRKDACTFWSGSIRRAVLYKLRLTMPAKMSGSASWAGTALPALCTENPVGL